MNITRQARFSFLQCAAYTLPLLTRPKKNDINERRKVDDEELYVKLSLTFKLSTLSNHKTVTTFSLVERFEPFCYHLTYVYIILHIFQNVTKIINSWQYVLGQDAEMIAFGPPLTTETRRMTVSMIYCCLTTEENM